MGFRGITNFFRGGTMNKQNVETTSNGSDGSE